MDKNNFTEKLDLPSGISSISPEMVSEKLDLPSGIVSISPEMASSELFRQKFYDTYRTVFGNNPWNEYLVCSNCNAKYGTSLVGDNYIDLRRSHNNHASSHIDCPMCNMELSPYYTRDEIDYLIDSVYQHKGIIVIDYDSSNINGFASAYTLSVEELLQIDADKSHLQFKLKEESNVLRNKLLELGFGPNSRFFYISEIGIVKDHQSIVALYRLLQGVRNNVDTEVDGILSLTMQISSFSRILSRFGFQFIAHLTRNNTNLVLMVGQSNTFISKFAQEVKIADIINYIRGYSSESR